MLLAMTESSSMDLMEKFWKRRLTWEIVTMKWEERGKNKPFIGRLTWIFPIQVSSREWLLFWRSEGSKKHQKWKPNTKRSFLIDHLVKHNAAVITHFSINLTSWMWSQFLKQMYTRGDTVLYSLQSFTTSLISLSSAGDMQKGIINCSHHLPVKIFWREMLYNVSMTFHWSQCIGELESESDYTSIKGTDLEIYPIQLCNIISAIHGHILEGAQWPSSSMGS